MNKYKTIFFSIIAIVLSNNIVLAEAPQIKNHERVNREESVLVKTKETNSENQVKTILVEENPLAELTPEELANYQKFLAGDRLYLAGDKIGAAKIYQNLKKPFVSDKSPAEKENIPQAIYDKEKLKTSGKVYWRLYQQGKEQKLESKILTSLELLVKQNPEFIPGYIEYSQALQDYQKTEEAVKILTKAVAQYPNEPELLKAKIDLDNQTKKWLDASITARQFALFNPQHPQAEEFLQLAQENFRRYQNDLNSKLTTNLLGNIITGALGYIVTGNLFGPLSALETSMLLLQGESAVGEGFVKGIEGKIPLVKDENVLAYVNEIVQKLSQVSGRNDFNYQVYIILDDELNAFALPGGKIFLNAGAIMSTNSEAELAGLLAHELSHAALSHSFQLITQGNFTANIAQFIPYVGSTAANLLVLNYSRDMERQADTFGTKILATSGYAADGLYNIMVALDRQIKEKKKDRPHPPEWLSSHPETQTRIKYIENLITTNNFNRYAYEGVEKHQKMKHKVKQLYWVYQQTEEDRQTPPKKK